MDRMIKMTKKGMIINQLTMNLQNSENPTIHQNICILILDNFYSNLDQNSNTENLRQIIPFKWNINLDVETEDKSKMSKIGYNNIDIPILKSLK